MIRDRRRDTILRRNESFKYFSQVRVGNLFSSQLNCIVRLVGQISLGHLHQYLNQIFSGWGKLPGCSRCSGTLPLSYSPKLHRPIWRDGVRLICIGPTKLRDPVTGITVRVQPELFVQKLIICVQDKVIPSFSVTAAISIGCFVGFFNLCLCSTCIFQQPQFSLKRKRNVILGLSFFNLY